MPSIKEVNIELHREGYQCAIHKWQAAGCTEKANSVLYGGGYHCVVRRMLYEGEWPCGIRKRLAVVYCTKQTIAVPCREEVSSGVLYKADYSSALYGRGQQWCTVQSRL